MNLLRILIQVTAWRSWIFSSLCLDVNIGVMAVLHDVNLLSYRQIDLVKPWESGRRAS